MKIDRDVPPPAGLGKYPWPEMEAGSSVLFPYGDDDRRRLMMRVSNAAQMWVKRNRPDLQQVVRSLDDGVRVWFIKREET